MVKFPIQQSVHVHLGMIRKNHISGDGPGQGRKDCGSAGGRGAALWLHRDWLRSQGVEPGGADQRCLGALMDQKPG